ncbi:hypothetical protein Q4489_04390 [Thalassotalea sp. 1_MG-2023]|uniref:hypothetical protein n=1 Tax=Thalassotalea sp. 1_MG-2023 TaxID=3062680 RepID=UPI0026E2D4C6|nr:hypothetical protein [Thalassotalea sp. 1_MG-2023]MDO6426236.1 hypothetical protein [Thalassotalea sp. 1_MG-2023]
MKSTLITIKNVLAALKHSQYQLFEGELNLNIIGVRSKNTRANTFNDMMCVLYQMNGQWQLVQYKCTTDPGIYYRKNPINVDGTAVVAPMQHKSVWTFGMHQGKYPALVQNKPITVFRDGNKDETIDTDVTLKSVKKQKGYFGINCHRASEKNESKQVNKWSAGCQVLAKPEDFDEFLTLCRQSAKTWGNTFTYTLLEQQQLEQK